MIGTDEGRDRQGQSQRDRKYLLSVRLDDDDDEDSLRKMIKDLRKDL